MCSRAFADRIWPQILGVELTLPSRELAKLRQRIDDNEPSVRVGLQPSLNVGKAALVCARPFRGDFQILRPRYRKCRQHLRYAALQATAAILQCEVENISSRWLERSKREPAGRCGYGNIEHQPALAEFRTRYQQRGSLRHKIGKNELEKVIVCNSAALNILCCD